VGAKDLREGAGRELAKRGGNSCAIGHEGGHVESQIRGKKRGVVTSTTKKSKEP